MKWIVIIVSIMNMSLFLEANMLDRAKEKLKNIGKQTPIDIALYAKNPSGSCSLTITNITNPYKKDLTQKKLKPIMLEPGRYFRGDVYHLLKGPYEFEYKWMKGERFVDSRLKAIRIFTYHDTRNRMHKKVNLSFLLRAPKGCM